MTVLWIVFTVVMTSLASSGWLLTRLLELELDTLGRELEKLIDEGEEMKKFTFILNNVKKTEL
jgi:hypothetical protein